jgi:hypothetical protein
MKIFRVTAEKTKELETLVIAKDLNEAKSLTLKGIINSELEFDNVFDSNHIEITSAYPADITEHTLFEIRDYGILNEEAELIYDTDIIEDLSNYQRKKQKEENLKKNHLELNLGI